MDDFLRRMREAQKKMKEAQTEVAEEVATEILAVAIDKASGPNYMSEYNKHRRAERRRKRKLKKLSRILPFLKYDETGKLKYPVPVITGTFRRAHKIRRVSRTIREVYGDLNTANYFTYVHDGTSRMEGRATIDDAANEVAYGGKAREIAVRIVNEKLQEVK